MKTNLFENIEDTPREHYTFHFEPHEIAPVARKYTGRMKKRLLLSVAIVVCLIALDVLMEGAGVAFALGFWIATALMFFMLVRGYKKTWQKTSERYKTTLFDYTLYDDFLIVWMASENRIRQMKVNFSEIKRVQTVEGILVMEIDGQLFLMKKHALVDHSFFLTLGNQK
jgi:hypothetical protein